MLSHELQQQLIRLAQEARPQAYAPYSHYLVGAALLTASGKMYSGVNIENAAYPSGICAERVAVFKAVSDGEKQFQALAVVTKNGGFPCGACRQVLAEFGLDTLILIANEEGKLLRETSLEALLPKAFLPIHLQALTPDNSG